MISCGVFPHITPYNVLLNTNTLCLLGSELTPSCSECYLKYNVEIFNSIILLVQLWSNAFP